MVCDLMDGAANNQHTPRHIRIFTHQMLLSLLPSSPAAQPAAVELFTFNSPKVVEKWHVFTDAYFGGRSQASFTYNADEQVGQAANNTPQHYAAPPTHTHTQMMPMLSVGPPALQAAEFSGRVTLEQDEDADIKRAGYCVASSKVTHIADYFDLSGCTHLVLNLKGDGRTYIANVRTDSIAGTGGDVWQAPIKTR